MLHSSSKPYENHHLILDHIESHLSQDIEDHIPQFYKKSTPISSTSSPEPMHHHHIHPHHVYQQQFRVIKDGRQVYEESGGGYQVSSSGSHHAMDTKPIIEMAPPTSTQKVKIICSEEPTSSMPDLGEFFKFFIIWKFFNVDCEFPDKIDKFSCFYSPFLWVLRSCCCRWGKLNVCGLLARVVWGGGNKIIWLHFESLKFLKTLHENFGNKIN